MTPELPSPVIHEFAPVAQALLKSDVRKNTLNGAMRGEIVGMINEIVADTHVDVLSLDVFDTFLLRNDKSEARRFLEISALARRRVAKTSGRSLEALPSDLDFLTARTDAMALCYRTRTAVEGCREGHIRDIVRTARRALDLPPGVETTLLDAELEYEANNLTLNLALLDVVRAVKARGGRVILMSDMYLGKEEITAIVRRLDKSAVTLMDAVFSSADHVVSKRAGKLFALVERTLEEAPEAFLHIGDALEGDVVQARKAGWGALHFPISRAEAARRRLDLACFEEEMQMQGHDVTRWAKV